MSIFNFGGVACLIKNVLSVRCNNNKKDFSVELSHLKSNVISVAEWKYDSFEIMSERFNEIVKLLEEKGWGKE